MLLTLSITHFAIVNHLELDFANGLSVFTGETGAGKSIIIDALMLVLGGRADTSVIRVGEDRCDISASFQVQDNSEPAEWLKENDIFSENGLILLRRVLYAEGRSKSYINGHPFVLHKIKELGEMLVQIYGQHQHQTLMQHVVHRQQLDHYAGHSALLDEVGSAYKQCSTLKKNLELLTVGAKQDDRRGLLQFQIDELATLNLQESEMQVLHTEHQLLQHACDYLRHAQQLIQGLNGEETTNACKILNQSLHCLSLLPQDHLQIKTISELLTSALIQIEEACSEIQNFTQKIDLDPQRLSEVEERISALFQMARKYQVEASQLPVHALRLKEELQTLQAQEAHYISLQQQLEQAREVFQCVAQKLNASRQNYAAKLGAEITTHIRRLAMPKGQIKIALSPLERMQAHGLDKVEYKVCTNPGTAYQSLSKIASGGELSRISLAIQIITAQRGATPTLIFDEVDVGIGGATAALVGQSLRHLGERLQVFCVTHQPQVASCAHHHFVVEKHNDTKQTYSTIVSLTEEQRINELSRMLGGLKVTEQTRSHAKELLQQSHEA